MSNAIGTVQLLRDFRRARNAGVPILAIDTLDQSAAIEALTKPREGEKLSACASLDMKAEPPIVVWDAVNGTKAHNKAGERMLKDAPKFEGPASINFVTAMVQAQMFEKGTVIIVKNAHRQFTAAPQPVQVVANLRNPFKENGTSLVLLAPKWTLPEEIRHDVIRLSDPLPDSAVLGKLVTESYANADLAAPDATTLSDGVDALMGLPAFEAEQQSAMSMEKAGLNIPIVWSRKCETIASTSEGGLTIGQTPVRFADMGGNAQVKKFGHQLIAARWFSTVWFIDEIEKDMAGIHSDSSGVAQFQHKKILTFTQKYKIPAMLLIGQPGSGKTLFAHAIAGEAKVPLAEMNLGDLKGKHVGESEQNTSRALETLLAISQGKLLLVATCNDVGTLSQSPELLRRFKLPKFYFDLPSAEERAIIWGIAGGRYGVDVSPAARPDDTDWTGSEIDSTCEMANRLKISVKEAAEWIVPMAVSSKKLVEKRREDASGNYLSANYPGTYFKDGQKVDEELPSAKVQGRRRLAVG